MNDEESPEIREIFKLFQQMGCFDDPAEGEEKGPQVSKINKILQGALAFENSTNDETVERALSLGASPLRHEDGFDPLFASIRHSSAVAVDLIIKDIISCSQVSSDTGIDEDKTRQALNENLYYHTEDGDKENDCASFPLQCAARKSRETLETVWKHFKGNIDINQPGGLGNRPVHSAALIPENLVYLLAEGADINAQNGYDETPLMRMLYGTQELNYSRDTIHGPQYADDPMPIVERLLKIYENSDADIYAVDYRGRGLPFHTLETHGSGMFSNQQLRCIDWVLGQDIDFLAKDKESKTPIDYLMADKKLSEFTFVDIFRKLAEHGYDSPALMGKYAGHPAIKRCVENHLLKKDFQWPDRWKKAIGRVLERQGPAAKLWESDDAPSKLLLSAFGYGVADKIFSHPSLTSSPAAAKALYRKMERKLPPQCKEFLHNGIDTAYFRDTAKLPPASAITKALRRKDSPPEGKAPGSGRSGGI